MMSITREQLLALIELAEDSIHTGYSEFGNKPTDEDRELLLAMYRVAGKEVPPFFARTFGWNISEIKPDGQDSTRKLNKGHSDSERPDLDFGYCFAKASDATPP